MTDVTDATFQTAVLDRSDEVPVVVDLWAPWCGPCTQLGPILEKVIGATDGKVELVKVNIDENPQVVPGLPGPVDPRRLRPQGRCGRGQLHRGPGRGRRAGLRRRPPAQRDRERRIEALLAAGDEASLEQALTLVPDDERAVVALADLWVDDGRAEEALELLTRIPESPETRRVAAKARTGEAAVDGDEISGRLDGLLDRVKDDDEARQEFVDLLELLGPDDPRTAAYRKRLSQRLF